MEGCFLIVNEDCIFCDYCSMFCPVEAIQYHPSGALIYIQESCICCGRCVYNCPVGAITKIG